MDTQNIKSGQNGQTDVQDDNRIIVKITKVKDISDSEPGAGKVRGILKNLFNF